MRGLEVVGPFKGSSGYDRHTREFVREFVRQGTAVELVHLNGWSNELPESMRETWFDGLNLPVGADATLHFTTPDRSHPRFGKRNVNYTMFEADRIPNAWARRAFAHDLIVLPTESSLRAWADSGVPRHMLRICPLGVDAAHFAAPVEPAPLTVPDGRQVASFHARFLNIGELRPRKNHAGLLRAWIKATHRDDDAVLILKASVFQDRVLPQFQADVAEMQTQEGRSLADAAPVLMLTSAVADEMVRALYAAATHYISLSHGEGWDQPMMEAAVSGLQVIAPAHSAYLSYLTPADAYLLPAKQVPAAIDGHLGREDRMLFDGLEWWNPDVDAAAELIRAIVAGRAEPKSSPKARIAAEYTWANAAARLLELINCSVRPPEKSRVLHIEVTR